MPTDGFRAPFPIDLHGVSEDDSIAAVGRLFTADVGPARVAVVVINRRRARAVFMPPPDLSLSVCAPYATSTAYC